MVTGGERERRALDSRVRSSVPRPKGDCLIVSCLMPTQRHAVEEVVRSVYGRDTCGAVCRGIHADKIPGKGIMVYGKGSWSHTLAGVWDSRHAAVLCTTKLAVDCKDLLCAR